MSWLCSGLEGPPADLDFPAQACSAPLEKNFLFPILSTEPTLVSLSLAQSRGNDSSSHGKTSPRTQLLFAVIQHVVTISGCGTGIRNISGDPGSPRKEWVLTHRHVIEAGHQKGPLGKRRVFRRAGSGLAGTDSTFLDPPRGPHHQAWPGSAPTPPPDISAQSSSAHPV